MDILKIAAIGITAGIIGIALKKTNPEATAGLSVAVGILILIIAVKYLSEAVGFIRSFKELAPEGFTGMETVLKVMGIAYISQFSSDTLRDCEMAAVASKVELAGKLIITVMTLPLFKTLAKTIIDFTKL